jgi:hypothetical protein
MSHKQRPDEGGQEIEALARDEFTPLAPYAVGIGTGVTGGLDPERFKILKRPPDSGADGFSTSQRNAGVPPVRRPTR